MKLQVLVVAVTACGGGRKPPTANTGAGAGTGPLYASVFVKGTTWTFSAETKTTPPIDMGQPTTEAKPDIVCTVTDVHEMPSKAGPVSMATVGCVAGTDTSPTGNQPPAGIYASSAAGLWWFGPDDPKAHDKAMALDPRELVIPATSPIAHKQEGKSDDGIESWLYESKQEGDAACGYFSSAAGDEGGWGVCFDGKGMVKASHFQAGATTQETFYTRK